MPKFKYVGDPNDRFSGPDTIHQYGQVFRKGEVVDVPDKSEADQENVRRLQGNSHFVDLSDKDEVADVAARQKAIEKAEADKAKAEAEQRKREEADAKERERNAQRASGGVTAATAPRPPGNVTRDPVQQPFGGRPVEERTPAEDHTKAGKTKS